MRQEFNMAGRYKFRNLGIFFLLILFFLFRLHYSGYSQRWDSRWYLDLLNTAISIVSKKQILSIFWWKQLWQAANFLGHPSIGYVGWLLFIGKIVGFKWMVDITNIILAIFAISSFYKIIIFFSSKDRIGNLLATALFAFNPLFLASSVSLNLDFPILVFEIIWFESLLNKKYLLSALSGLMLVFSKEIGLLVYFATILGFGVFYWRRTKLIKLGYIVFPGLIWLLSYLLLGKLGWNNTNVPVDKDSTIWRWGNNCMFCFGINFDYIKVRLFQIFVMNFGWVMLLVDIFAIVKFLIYFSVRKRFLSANRNQIVWGLILGLVFFGWIISNLLLVVMPFSRYMTAGIFFVIIFFVIALQYLLQKNYRVKYLVLTLLLCLNIIQAVIAVDPVVGWFYGVNYLGSHKSSPIYGYHDGLVYNLQFMFVDGLEKEVEKAIGGNGKLLGDDTTGYFFQHIPNVISLNTIDKSKLIKGETWQYIDVPWLQSTNSQKIVDTLFNKSGSKNVEWHGYEVIIDNLIVK